MVVFAIRLQELAGIDVVSDGGWRRTHYTDEFLERIGGFRPVRRFMHQGEERYWHRDYSAGAYPTVEHFLDHCAVVLAREAKAVEEAGIGIVQIDDPALTYLCDRRLTSGEKIHDERLHREWDAERELPRAVEAINRVTEGLCTEVHLHYCHSVYHLMSDVTGEVSDLSLLPKGLGMGVIDVRQEATPPLKEVVSLASRAVEILGPDRIAQNPDCGFDPGAAEPPSIDEAFGKLKLLSAAAAVLR